MIDRTRVIPGQGRCVPALLALNLARSGGPSGALYAVLYRILPHTRILPEGLT